ncbi:unnamed protein product [Discula destructiva]
MKQRFSSLDVKVTAHELSQSLIGLRLANVYDISSKKLLLKFAVSGKKEQLIIDSGFCTHLTDFNRATAAFPSAFTSRLRKSLKTRRCTSVKQIGTDRIIELQFSDGAYHVFLEFFAAGNVILTDAEFKILAILRNVSEGEGQEPQRVGATYSLQNRQNYGGVPPLTRDRVRTALETSLKKAEATETSTKKKHKRKPGDELRRALATSVEELPPIVVDHAFAVTGFEPTSQPAEVLENEALFESLFTALEEARKIVDEVTNSATCKGYIIAKRREPLDEALPDAEKPQKLLYEDFQPFLPRKFEANSEFTVLTYDNFNKTIDEFFSSLEGQKLEGRLNEREEAAKRKLEAVKQIQEQKVEGLKQAQMLNMRKAGAIEANVDRVAEAMDAVNGLIKQGMDWVNIGKLIQREQKRRNPVAEIIKLPLNLEQNTITLLLAEEDVQENDEDSDEGDHTSSEDGSEGEEDDKGKATDDRLSIEINLGLSPFANAREYYDQKKVAAVKAQKTEEHSVTALRNAEKKIALDLKKGLKGEKPILQLTRHQMWFEKFLWFISSDGYLVVGGRDAGTNEVLYKKHLRKGDIYVHADMPGAASVIIKNNPKTPDAPIPPSTLTQAGSLSVCSSNAWDSKAGMGAWWVHADQVSKSAPTGDILPAGSFMVRGTKNILTPQPLVMGFGFMFKISEETKGHHVKNRLQEADDARTEAYVTGGKAAGPSGGNMEDDLASDDAITSSLDNSEARDDLEDQAEQQDGRDDVGDAQDDAETAQRQNPLQIVTDFEENEAGSSEEEHEEDDGELDIDTDHVKDGLADLSIGESPEAMMSGALDTYADNEEEEPDDKAAAEGHAEASNSDDDGSDTPTEAPTTSMSTTTGAGAGAGTTATQQKPASTTTNKRGRRAKQKKIAAKYAHQDAEDRALHEQLIGATKGREKAAAEAAAKAAAKAADDERRERRRAAMERQKAKVAEHEEARRRKFEQGLKEEEDDDAEGVEETAPLDALVGTPFVGDEILELIPVCAPWTAMGKCKYKVKIQPGSTKKGKAIKEVLERWKLATGGKGNVDEAARDRERMWPREVELIKALKPEEANNVVPVGKMTVVLSGGTARGGKVGGGGGKGKSGRGGRGSKKK